MTTQRMPSDNRDARDATTNAAVAAGSAAGPGPEQDYRLINLPREA